MDVSRAGAASPVVAETVLRDVRLDRAAKEGIDFRIPVSQIDPVAHYSVRALIDLDGDGRASVGDYVSTQSHPVLTRGHPDRVEILVRLVR
jgi:hypothetical protein